MPPLPLTTTTTKRAAYVPPSKAVAPKYVEDLVLLTNTTEDGVACCLQAGFKQDKIYTFIGPVLVSVNPFKQAAIQRVKMSRPSNPDATRSSKGQCILITGESGAGKTEAAKRVMEYVMAAAAAARPSAKATGREVQDLLLQSNPLLEAFGNAKTVRNENSSRFGKYVEIFFDYQGQPLGGRVSKFLLEKSRVCVPGKGERSFHIFYQLLAMGGDGGDGSSCVLHALGELQAYSYLARSGTTQVAGLSDADEWSATAEALTTLGFSPERQTQLMELVAAVLAIGNISFQSNRAAGQVLAKTDSQAAVVHQEDSLKVAAAALKVDPRKLASALTNRTIATGIDRMSTPLDAAQSAHARDALAKALYARAFDALVEQVNRAVAPPPHAELTLGVLDIYGFEIFEANSFEQLCINFANEKLQQLFIEFTLRAEQAEYAAEGVAWTPVEFFNNCVVVELIEGSRPAGVLLWLDEECVVPKGTDASFLTKLASNLSKHPHLEVSKDQAARTFTIKHYAGDVAYAADGLIEKNKDLAYRNQIEMLSESASPLIAELFPAATRGKTSAKKIETAGAQFRKQMDALAATIGRCAEPHYIRCIKPNLKKRPADWDAQLVAHQVRYLGIVENVLVRRAGFAHRMPFSRFLGRYKMICRGTWPAPPAAQSPADSCAAILAAAHIVKAGYELGKTKVFLRAPASVFTLEDRRSRALHDVARILQGAYRSFAARRYRIKLREKSMAVFEGLKRRRGSWRLPFLGDYLDAAEAPEVTRMLLKAGEARVYFADRITHVNRNGKAQERILLISDRSVYVLAPTKWRVNVRVAFDELEGISLSTFADGFMVVHVGGGAKGGGAALLLQVQRKAEVVTMLVQEAGASVVCSDTIEFRSKRAGMFETSATETRTITFVESAATAGSAALLDEKSAATGQLRVLVPPVLGSKAELQIGKGGTAPAA